MKVTKLYIVAEIRFKNTQKTNKKNTHNRKAFCFEHFTIWGALYFLNKQWQVLDTELVFRKHYYFPNYYYYLALLFQIYQGTIQIVLIFFNLIEYLISI